MSPECQEQGLAAHPTSRDSFPLTQLLVTYLEESTVTLAHQLYNFGATGHKFVKNLGDVKQRLIRAAAKRTLYPAFLSQRTTYGRQTQSSAKPSKLWPIDWAIN